MLRPILRASLPPKLVENNVPMKMQQRYVRFINELFSREPLFLILNCCSFCMKELFLPRALPGELSQTCGKI
jgi:hypothetical protein